MMADMYGPPRAEVLRGDGDHVETSNGRYLDLTGGIAVNALGHGAPEITEAVTRQLQEVSHTSNLFTTPTVGRLAKRLSSMTHGHHVFFCNSGSEANEAAIKVVQRARGTGPIVAFEGGFHGRTLGALSATHKPAAREGFGAAAEVIHVPWNDAAALEDALQDATAVIAEPVLGEGGVHEMSADVEQMLIQTDALVVLDEVQTGIGRTGTFWAHEGTGIRPDIVTSAKGLAGGLPLGACMIDPALLETMGPGSHGSTFGGNPVSCAAAHAVLDAVDAALLSHVQRLGERVRQHLGEAGLSVRGRGLLLGIAMSDAAAAADAVRRLDEHRILTTQANDAVRLTPSLRIPEDTLMGAVQTMERILA